MSRRSAVALSTILLVVPFFASAQATSAQVQMLLAQIAALQAQLQTLSQVNTQKTQSPAPAIQVGGVSGVPGGNICYAFSRTLLRGSTGDDVKTLQLYLMDQGLLVEGSATGYYGVLTEAAVQKWQAAYGVVTSGTPLTNGYGVVGVRTRALLQLNCKNTSTAQQASCPLAPKPTTACAGTWNSIANAKGCTTAWQCSFAAPGSQSGTMACPMIALACPAGKHDQTGPNCSHSCVSDVASTPTSGFLCPQYVPPTCSAGTLQSRGLDSQGCSLGYRCVVNPVNSNCPIYQTTCLPGTHKVNGAYSSVTGCYAAPSCVEDSASGTFSVSPSSGTAQLPASFTAHLSSNPIPSGASYSVGVDHGDGTIGAMGSSTDCTTGSSNCSAYNYSGKHTYTYPGTYSARLMIYSGCTVEQAATGCSGAPAQVASYLGPSASIAVGASRSQYFSAGPITGTSPLSVRFFTFAPEPSTGGYSIDFGDGQSITLPSCASGASSCAGFEDHTYTTGSYNVLYRAFGNSTIGTIPVTVQ